MLIDCPPALGLLTVNALVASNYALLSAEAQYFALQGVEQALEVIELARDSLNPDLEWLGVVLNIADMRTRHSREAFDSLREHFGDKLVQTTIRSSIAYAESAERAVSILDYRPDLAVDYLDVADELLTRLDLSDARTSLRKLRRGAGARPASEASQASPGLLGRRQSSRTSAPCDSNGARMTRAQPSAAPLRRSITRARLLVAAPHQDRGPRAGDRGPQRPLLGGVTQELGRPRVEVGAVGLVQPVDEAGGDQVPAAGGQAQGEGRCGGDVEHRVADGHGGGQRGAGLGGAHRHLGDDEDGLEAHGRLEAVARRRPGR